MAAAPLFVPASAFGANDRISYGVIATGGRGRYICTDKFQKLGAQCVALCDVYEPNLGSREEAVARTRRHSSITTICSRKRWMPW